MTHVSRHHNVTLITGCEVSFRPSKEPWQNYSHVFFMLDHDIDDNGYNDDDDLT